MSGPAAFFLMAGLVAFMIGLSKGGLSGTLGALATPLLALVLPASQVVPLLLPVLMLADLFALALHWGRWNRRLIVLLLPGAVIGVTAGTYVITNAPTQALRTVLGIIVLGFTLYRLLQKRLFQSFAYHSRSWHGTAAGVAAGLFSALAHTGGPPVDIYLLMQNVQPAVFVATSVLFFSILNWIKVPYYWYAGLFDWEALLRILPLLPLVPLGVWVGKMAAYRVDKQTFDRLITALLGVTAVILILG